MDLPKHIGRYEILGLLGTGGMAEVLLGRLVGPSGFQRPVVIKRILPHLARERSFVDMFIDEARIVSGIRHPNVVQVQELGQDGDELFLVMEYLEGESLASLTRRLASQRKLLSFYLCAHVISEVCAGLHAAHELTGSNGELLGVVHRDISPSNIFVTYDGQVKVLDFGIATATDRVTRTEAGHVKGKYTYMSPEQCRGERLDRRSDIFSLGIVLYELSTCRRLFKRPSEMMTLEAICHQDVLPPSTLIAHYPKSVEAVAMRALSRQVDARYMSASEMRKQIAAAARDLNQSRIPEDTLSNVMHRLFADRVDEKRRLLMGLESGDDVSSIPSAEVDEAFDLPTVVELSSPRSVSMIGTRPHVELPPPAPLWPKKAWIAGALAAGVTVIAGTALMTAGNLGSADAVNVAVEPRSQEVTVPKDSELFRVVEPVAKYVELEVVTEPSGATITLRGEVRGETPLKLKIPAGDVATELLVERRGFKAVSEIVVPDRDQRLRLSLEPEPRKKKPAKDKSGKKSETVEEEEDPYRRFD